MATAIVPKRGIALATVLLGFACCFAVLAPADQALALDEPPYTPGENYYIDEEEAFRDQDVDHDAAAENEAATSYYLTSPFYVNWISPDVTVKEGEQAYIGCGAVGLEEIRYEWFMSADGGETFEPTGLVGNEHCLTGLVALEGDAPYLYRCVVTNGDQTSKLEADVWVTVLDVPAPAGDVLGELGDRTMTIACAFLGIAFLACAMAIPLLMRRVSKDDRKTPGNHYRGL